MQNSFQTRVKSTLLFGALFLILSGRISAQSGTTDLSAYRAEVDSLFKVAELLCKDDSTSKLASSWVLKSNTILAIMDDAELKEHYKDHDLQNESARCLLRIVDLDKKKEFRTATESNLATCCIDLGNLGMDALETSKQFNSPADAEKAAELFQLCLETYKQTGASQVVVDRFWKEENLSWQWIRFYKAVAFRKAGKADLAEKEYGIIQKIGWKNQAVYLELADLMVSKGKPEDAIKILIQGNELLPESIPIACALTRLYLNTDKLKKALPLIKQYDSFLGSNSELVLTKALVYEKKGDFKKADALFKAVYKSDPNEVRTNAEYAGYLIRKAVKADPMFADEFSQLAYNLMYHATELSPENASLKTGFEEIKKQFPKVKLEEVQ